MAISLTINSVTQTSKLERLAGGGRAFTVDQAIGNRAELRCNVRDTDSTASAYRPTLGQSIVLADGATTLFSGTIVGVADKPLASPATGTLTEVIAADQTLVCDRIRISRTFASGQTLKAILQSILATELAGLGITLDASQANGPTMNAVTFDNVTVTEAFNSLSTLTTYVWRIKPDATLRFFTIGTLTTSYSLTAALKNAVGPVTWSKTRGDYANKIILNYGPEAVIDKADTITTTTGQTSWTLTYVPNTKTGRGYLTVNGTVTPMGIYGVDSTTYTLDQANKTVHRTSAPPNGTVLGITYGVQFPQQVTVNDATLQSSDGVYTKTYQEKSITNLTEATDYANGLLSRDKTTPQIVQAQTYAGIAYVADAITLTFTARTISGSYLITNVSMTDSADGRVLYTLTCASGSQAPGAWLDFWKQVTGAVASNTGGSVTGGLIPNYSGNFPGDVTAGADASGGAIVRIGGIPWSAAGGIQFGQYAIADIAGGAAAGCLRILDTAAFDPTTAIVQLRTDATVYAWHPGQANQAGGIPCNLGYDNNNERWNAAYIENGVYEHGRAKPIGEWTSFTPSGTTGNGSMTWGTFTTLNAQFMYVGKTMWIKIGVSPSTIGGTVNNILLMTLPDGATAATRAYNPCYGADGNGTALIGVLQVGAGATQLQFVKQGAANWTAGANCSLFGQIAIEIQ